MRSDISNFFVVMGAGSSLVGAGLFSFGAAVAGAFLFVMGAGLAGVGALFRQEASLG